MDQINEEIKNKLYMTPETGMIQSTAGGWFTSCTTCSLVKQQRKEKK